MSVSDHPSRALLDGALPLARTAFRRAAASGGSDGIPVLAVTTLYLVFAAGIATMGSERPGEPPAAWRLYALSMAALAVIGPVRGLVRSPPASPCSPPASSSTCA